MAELHEAAKGCRRALIFAAVILKTTPADDHTHHGPDQKSPGAGYTGTATSAGHEEARNAFLCAFLTSHLTVYPKNRK
jgi:hypothetical protein